MTDIKNFSDEIQTSIFDLGSYNYRIGYSGHDRPSFIFPPIKFNENDKENKYEYLTSQNGDGSFTSMQKFEEFFDDFITKNEMQNQIHQGSLLFSESLIHNKEQRMKLTEFLFEKYQISDFFICNTAVLSSFSYGKCTNLIFDSGHNQSSVVPVHDGMIIKNSLLNSEIKGKFIDDIVFNEVIKKQINDFNYDIIEHISIMNDIKDMIFTQNNNKNNNYKLPDGKEILLNDEFLNNSKNIVENKIFSNENGIKKIILNSISSVNIDIKKDLIGNIFVCGGNSLIFNNYFEKIKENMSRDVTNGTVIKIITHPSKIDRALASFLGASIVSSLNIYREVIVKKDEYEEHGAIVIEKKCA